MSAILSADDLNDFISPGVACIKPVETLPKQNPADTSNPYEVTTEEKLAANGGGGDSSSNAQISLTDCLACSGCVTSAEAVLVSLQSHEEVITTLDRNRSLSWQDAQAGHDGKVFVASVSPQTRANIAATYGVSEKEAGYMIEDLLRGPHGLPSTGMHNSGFEWVLDTNATRQLCLDAGVQELLDAAQPATSPSRDGTVHERPRKPVLSSACPGWICYAEKTHPHVLPHLSRLKSPQAMMGTLIKSCLGRRYGVAPDKIWHVAIMPCFDKKLEASREELTDAWWRPDASEKRGVRDVDCVITARELVMLADSRNIAMPSLSRRPLQSPQPAFPDPAVDSLLFPRGRKSALGHKHEAGPSGGYAFHMLKALQRERPGSSIRIDRGRNADVIEYVLEQDGAVMLKTSRYYGFRNIQNLVRGLKPARGSRLPGAANRRAQASGPRGGGVSEFAYVEVMACPGGCTNGGGQIKASDVAQMRGLAEAGQPLGLAEQKQWLAQIDEAYYSADSSDTEEGDANGGDPDAMDVDPPVAVRGNGGASNAISPSPCRSSRGTEHLLRHWEKITGIPIDKLILTAYRQVESNVGKESQVNDVERVAGLASTIGGGW